MTVAHIVQDLDVGGLERVVMSLLDATDPARYRTVLYTLGEGGDLAGEVERRGHAVRRLAKRSGLDYVLFPRLVRCLRADAVDVVHAHNYSALVYGSIAGRIAGVGGVIYTAHGAKTASRRATRRYQRLGLVDDVVFVSGDALRVALAAGAVEKRNLHTIENGVRLEEYARSNSQRLAARQSLGIDAAAPVVGIVARLTRAKDHVNLLDAFARVRERHPAARCVIVGDGELRGAITDHVQALGLGKEVLMLGRRDDVADVLSAFDVYVLSSYTEGLAVTLLEAMAAGLPVVATDVGGNPEVVVDGVTGRLVPARDAAALADAIMGMLADRERARAMGEAGRIRCQERFGVNTMTRRYQKLYDRLAADGRGRDT
ncbi:MAG TPA: glycosyltransferase [Candidatus Krumholzibacteria bacterium]|nr:glycosyltransferase [Candidatus Krumholzibacteria bacterium]